MIETILWNISFLLIGAGIGARAGYAHGQGELVRLVQARIVEPLRFRYNLSVLYVLIEWESFKDRVVSGVKAKWAALVAAVKAKLGSFRK